MSGHAARPTCHAGSDIAAGRVGSVFVWRTVTPVSTTFGLFPLHLASWFFRFSWRVREPYGCVSPEFGAFAATTWVGGAFRFQPKVVPQRLRRCGWPTPISVGRRSESSPQNPLAEQPQTSAERTHLRRRGSVITHAAAPTANRIRRRNEQQMKGWRTFGASVAAPISLSAH